MQPTDSSTDIQNNMPRPDRLFHGLFVVALSLAITVIMVLYLDRLPVGITEGSIAMQDIRADQNYEITDNESTGKLKTDVAQKSLSVYDFNTSLLSERKKQRIKIEERNGVFFGKISKDHFRRRRPLAAF